MNHNSAVAYAFLAFTIYVLYDATVRFGRMEGLSSFEIMAALGIVGFTSLTLASLARGKRPVQLPKSQALHRDLAIIALSSVAMRFCNITALKYLPLTTFYIILFCAPLLIAALSALLKHEVLTRTRIACLVAGFLGVLFALVPQLASGGEGIGYAVAAASPLFFAVLTVSMRSASKKTSVQNIQFFNFLALGLAGIFGSLLQGVPLPSLKELGILALAGVMGTLGNLVYNKALKTGVSTDVAQMHYTQIATGGLIGYLIWNDIPSWNLILGSAAIVAAGLVLVKTNRKKNALV